MSIATTDLYPTAHDVPRRRPWLRSVPAVAHEVCADSTLPALVGSDLTVPTLRGERVRYANFDHAASTPAFAAVAQAVESASTTYSSVHRGRGYASQVSSRFYEAARAKVADFIGARTDDVVIFTRNTTDSFNLLASALPRRATVIVFASEHHAALLPWPEKRTVRLPVPQTLADATAVLRHALTHTDGERLVVLSGASNVTGELWPIKKLARLAKRHGARVALDAAQLAPHRRVEIEAWGVDYVAFSGHKLYAPYGVGVLAGRRDWLDRATPYLAGGGASAEVTEGVTRWHTGPARHEAGTPNVLGAVALASACAQFEAHADAIEEHERTLADLLLYGLSAIPGVETLSIFAGEVDRAPVVAFTVDGLESGLVSAALSAEYGIGVRDGKFCAHLLVGALLDGADSGATSAVRASAGLGTTQEDVERLLVAVRELAEHGPLADYVNDECDGWRPVDANEPAVAEAAAVPLPW